MNQKTYEKVCVMCNSNFTSVSAKATMCSTKCKQKASNNSTLLKKQKQLILKYENNPIPLPTCKICGWKSIDLHSHLMQSHKIDVATYLTQYDVTNEQLSHPDFLQVKRDRISGNKNPGFQHGGTMSSYSKKYIQYENMSDEEKTKAISIKSKQAASTRTLNNNVATTLVYYTSRGMSELEARVALSKRQRTFSLEICIEKYGKELGIVRWNERQEKWKKSLDALPMEEKQRILKAKTLALTNSYSHISRSLFDMLNQPEALYGSDEAILLVESENKLIRPDYLLGNKIIEFFGDFWHANPRKYNKDDVMEFPNRKVVGTTTTAGDVWIKDYERLNMLQREGYEILIVWEHDFKEDQQKVVDKCLTFLNR